MPTRPTIASVALCALLLVSCGGSSSSEKVKDEAMVDRAVNELVKSGLPRDQARCITEELGAETVVEASDIGVLTDGDAYAQAAERCIK